jgi:hypothetical protein
MSSASSYSHSETALQSAREGNSMKYLLLPASEFLVLFFLACGVSVSLLRLLLPVLAFGAQISF